MTMADSGMYLSALTYRSLTTSAIVDLRPERRTGRYERHEWWFSFGGRLEFGPYSHKMDALLSAAHAMGKSGNAAAWHPCEETA